jgi:hypothetical protein
MGKFLESEKPKQAAFKHQSVYFSEPARADGFYKTKIRPYCLPVDLSVENLFPEIRKGAVCHFTKHEIKWHDAHRRKPSNHMCDSMVCCVNFLFPFADKPQSLAKVLRRTFPEIRCMLPVEDGKFVSHEWIGAENYLGEKIPKNHKRTRGANFTSTDAIVKFQHSDGKIHVVLIEWKYTESYYHTWLGIARSGTSRVEIYRHLYDREDCILNKDRIPDFSDLFYEPFYQFMRQQLLAHEMEKAGEMGADIVSLLHIAPAHNRDFRRVTSPALKKIDGTATGVWKKLVKKEGRFKSVSTESLFDNPTAEKLPEMENWLEYIQERYSWVKEKLDQTF